MRKILHIALNTFRESVRDKVLYVIAFFAILMMIAGRAVGWVAVGEQVQIVQHFSFAVVSLFGALVAVFVGTGLIHKEIDKRTIYTILSKPIPRWQFVAGKYLGLLAVLACMVAGMGAFSCGFLAAVGGSVGAIHLYALAEIFLELCIVTALAIFFGSVASPILGAIFTFCAYLVGQVTPSLLKLVDFKPPETSVAEQTGEHLTDLVGAVHWLLKPLAHALYYILPDLTHFHLRNRIYHGPPLQDGEFLLAVGYALCYCTAVLVVAIFCFERRQF